MMDKEYFEDFNISWKDYEDDIHYCDKLTERLKKIKFNMEDYDYNDLIFSNELSEEEKIINKYVFIKKGKELRSLDKKEAIKYFEALLDNPYFENDYYIYRQLARLFKETKQFDKQLEIIKKYFKSGIYGSNYQYLWFSHKLLVLKKKGLTTDDEINEHLQYFMENGNFNKSKENYPVILAERIFYRKAGYVDIDNQYTYERTQIRYELEEIGRQLAREKDYEGIIEFNLGVLEHTNFKTTKIYKNLVTAYEKLGDYDSMVNIISLFFKNGYNIGVTTKDWFDKRINKINKKLGTSFTQEDFILMSIEELKEEYPKNSSSSINHKSSVSNDELLFKYAELYEKGLLTKEEFDKKKMELL